MERRASRGRPSITVEAISQAGVKVANAPAAATATAGGSSSWPGSGNHATAG